MNITESPPDKERMALIDSVANEAGGLLGFDLANDPPQSVMSKVDEVIVDLIHEKPTPVSEDENPDLLLGVLWGACLVRQFGWYWSDVVVDDQFDEVAVIAPQQEMIVFPLAFVAAVLDRQCVCTLALAFNMLLEEGQIEAFSPGAYENLMMGVHHLVPPYSLEASG